MMNARKDLTETQAHLTALEIIRMLEGLTIGEAKWVLRETELVLNSTHSVSVDNPLFTAADAALQRVLRQEA